MNNPHLNPAAGPVFVAAAAGLTAVAGRALHAFDVGINLWWIPTFVAAVAGVVLYTRRSGKPALTTWFRITTWVAAGIWATTTLAVGLSVVGLVVLVAGAALAGLLAPAFTPYIGRPVLSDDAR